MAIYMWREYVNPRRGPCDEGFHIPTNSDRNTIYDIGVALNRWSSSKNGMTELLKMPLTGNRSVTNSNVGSQGVQAQYRSSTAYSSANQSVNIILGQNAVSLSYGWRGNGFPIRPFKDEPVTPDSSWTALYSNKIYHNSSLGLISISSDGTNRITISDKNLGATTVYNYGDTLSEANCGKYYQRGNNYGFSWTGSVTTSSTRIDASSYGPGNYYSSSTFIIATSSPYNWDSSDNTNLRGGDEG